MWKPSEGAEFGRTARTHSRPESLSLAESITNQEQEASGCLGRKLCGAYLFSGTLHPWNVWNSFSLVRKREWEHLEWMYSRPVRRKGAGGVEDAEREKLKLNEREMVCSAIILVRKTANTSSRVDFLFLEFFKSVFKTLVGGKILLRETSFKCLFPKKTHIIPRHTPYV